MFLYVPAPAHISLSLATCHCACPNMYVDLDKLLHIVGVILTCRADVDTVVDMVCYH